MELIAGILLILLALFGEVALYRRHGTEQLSYRCRFSESECIEGETIQFLETVTNDKALAIPWLKTELTVSKWLDFPETNSTVTGENRFVTGFFSVRSNAKVSRVWKITGQKRGVYAIEHTVVVTSDLLGLVRLSLRAEDTGGTLTVLPKRLTEEGLLLPRLLQNAYGEQTVRMSFCTDSCLSAGVRPYVIGDALHRMHWKASAHAGTLLMRQEEHIARRTVAVFLSLESYAADSGYMTQDMELLEHTIRVCAECLWELCRSGWQVRLCIGECDDAGAMLATPYGTGNGMYHSMLRQLARLTLRHTLPLKKMLQIAKSGSAAESKLLITPYTDAFVRQWKQYCHGLVLVTGYIRDTAGCADAVVTMPKYREQEENR